MNDARLTLSASTVNSTNGLSTLQPAIVSMKTLSGQPDSCPTLN